MSRLLPAIATLTEVFNDYAGKDGVKDSLTKAELTELLKKEMYMEVSTKEDRAVIFL